MVFFVFFVPFVVQSFVVPRSIVVRIVVLVAASWCISCAPPLIKLPSGNGTPAADGADVIRTATLACRAVSTLTAEIAVSGSIGGQRLRARMLAGVAAPASARLEAVAPFGPPLFIFVARDNDATLLLGDDRVLEHGRPDALLEAVAGVPLDAAELRVTMTGCAAVPEAARARQLGDQWRIVPDGSSDLYLHRESATAPWRIVAAQHRAPAAWRAEYREFQIGSPSDGLPRAIRLTSADSKRFDVRLDLSQTEINTALGADVFRIERPSTVRPITLQELKESGPLGRR